MDIRLKNILYSQVAKIIAYIACVGGIVGIGMFMFYANSDQDALYKKDYYETDSFQESYVRLSHNAVEKQLDLIDEETIEANRTGLDKSISLDRLRAINDNLRRGASFIYLFINVQTNETMTNIDPSAWKAKYSSVEEYIKQFKTVVQWDESDIYFPPNSAMVGQPFTYRHYVSSSFSASTNVTASDVIYRLRGGEWIYYTAVDFSRMDEDILFGKEYQIFHENKEIISGMIPWLGISLGVLFFAFLYLGTVIGKKESGAEPGLVWFDRIPLEIQSVLLIASAIPLLDNINSSYQYGELFSVTVESEGIRMAFNSAIFGAASICILLSIIRQIKTKYIFRNPIFMKILWWVRDLFVINFASPIAKIKILFIIGCYMLFDLFIMFLMLVKDHFDIPIWKMALLVFLAVHLGLIVYILSIVKEISMLIKATRHRAEGDVDYPINEKEYRLGLRDFAKNLNALQNGLQAALEEAIKGEKLKTELITNVSHDLKNPLTSIVTYIDLLGKTILHAEKKELKEEEKEEFNRKIHEYIEVLNTKSYRLKTLIEDLVSASKASSGNMDVDLMNINIRNLMLQCLGEKEERFKRMNLTVVLSPEISEPVWTLVDPNHMYRVFDNLLSNMIKYSLSGTRVFIDVDKKEDMVVIELKNISNHPLDIRTQNLSKRFVRGDKSRTTEGSGLGLSIVESLLNLQNGSFEIIVDGDLFKVKIFIPKGEDVSALMTDNKNVNQQEEGMRNEPMVEGEENHDL